MSNELDHSQNECCCGHGHGHDTKRESISTLDSSVSANTETMLRTAGVDCAEEVAIIEGALKPIAGVRAVRVGIMSGKATIAHDDSVNAEQLISAIGDAGLSASRERDAAPVEHAVQ